MNVNVNEILLKVRQYFREQTFVLIAIIKIIYNNNNKIKGRNAKKIMARLVY